MDTGLNQVGEVSLTNAEGLINFMDHQGTYRLKVEYVGQTWVTREFTFNNTFQAFDLTDALSFEPPGFWQAPVVLSHNFQGFTKVFRATTIPLVGQLLDGSYVTVSSGNVVGSVTGNQFQINLPLTWGLRDYQIEVSKGNLLRTTLTVTLDRTSLCPKVTNLSPASGTVLDSGVTNLTVSLDSFVPDLELRYYPIWAGPSRNDFERPTLMSFVLNNLYLGPKAQGTFRLVAGSGACEYPLTLTMDLSNHPAQMQILETKNLVFSPFPPIYEREQKLPKALIQVNKPGELDIQVWPGSVRPFVPPNRPIRIHYSNVFPTIEPKIFQFFYPGREEFFAETNYWVTIRFKPFDSDKYEAFETLELHIAY